MDDITGYKVKDVEDKRVKDPNGKIAPPEVIKALKEAGVVSFACGRFDWEIIKADVESLIKRLSPTK